MLQVASKCVQVVAVHERLKKWRKSCSESQGGISYRNRNPHPSSTFRLDRVFKDHQVDCVNFRLAMVILLDNERRNEVVAVHQDALVIGVVLGPVSAEEAARVGVELVGEGDYVVLHLLAEEEAVEEVGGVGGAEDGDSLEALADWKREGRSS